MASSVKALLFDLGGVLINIDVARTLRAWSKYSALSLAEISAAFQQDLAYQQHETGEIAATEYFDHLRACLKLEASDAKIAEGWNALLLDEIGETVRAIQTARNQLQLPCYVFTNTNPTHQAVWQVRYAPMFRAFERVFVSSEIGLRKPHRAAFDYVVREMGVAANAVLFFDDLLDNVAGAVDAGLRAVQVRTPADVRLALQSLGCSFPV